MPGMNNHCGWRGRTLAEHEACECPRAKQSRETLERMFPATPRRCTCTPYNPEPDCPTHGFLGGGDGT